MKLLLDQNLSRMLVRRLSNEYPESVHVAEVGLDTAADRDIWEYAGEQGYVIVSKDSGSRSSVIRCSSPRLVLVRCSGCRSTRSARSSSNASQPIQRRAAGCSARKFAVCSTLASCWWELQDRVSGRWLSGRPGGEGGALSTGGAKRCPKALPGSTAKWSGPNVTVKFSMNPICPRMIEVPWCGHGSSTPASPCHDRRESMTPTGGIASKASSNSRASNARPPSRIGSFCPVAFAACPAEAITSSETTVSGPPVSISAVNDDRQPGTATRSAARSTGRPSVPCDSPKSV